MLSLKSGSGTDYTGAFLGILTAHVMGFRFVHSSQSKCVSINGDGKNVSDACARYFMRILTKV